LKKGCFAVFASFMHLLVFLIVVPFTVVEPYPTRENSIQW